MTEAHELLLDEYLRQLGRAARKLPVRKRQLFLAEVADRIDDELQASDDLDPDVMRGVLRRVGDPEALVRSRDRAADWPAAQELATVLALLAAGVVLPFVGWFVAVAMLWASPRWRLQDKLLGTLIWPGGLGGLALVCWLFVPAYLRNAWPTVVFAGAGSILESLIPWLVLMAVAGVPPVLVAVRLLRSARRQETDVPLWPADSATAWPEAVTAQGGQ
jgi:hypothetical protein